MIGGKQRRGQRDAGQTVGAILVVLPPFVEDNVALVLELLASEGRQQVAHSIRLHPQSQIQRARRHDFPIIGAIGVGRAIQQPSGLLERLKIPLIVML